MQFNQVLTVLFSLVLLVLSTGLANAGNVQFNGLVVPQSSSEGPVLLQPSTLVSFSDQVALALPDSFAADRDLQISNGSGELVKGFRIMSVAASNGTRTSLAVVDLRTDQRQTFQLCSKQRCIRYNVIKY